MRYLLERDAINPNAKRFKALTNDGMWDQNSHCGDNEDKNRSCLEG